jgi:hypothetical protein
MHHGLAPILILLLGFDQGFGRNTALPETTTRTLLAGDMRIMAQQV